MLEDISYTDHTTLRSEGKERYDEADIVFSATNRKNT